MKSINAGIFRHKIQIFEIQEGKDNAGFAKPRESLILTAHAQVRMVRGFTMIVNNSDFEKGYTNFTIRRPRVPIERGMIIKYARDGKRYKIEYINPLGVAGEMLEMQAKETEK